MSIRESLYFIFDNQLSTSFGIVSVSVSTGMSEEPFLASRTINETRVRGNNKPYFTSVTQDPLTFTLTFAFQNGFDSNQLRAVSRWLSVEYYKPLQFSDNLDRVYYAMLSGDSVLTHVAGQGYVTLTMRCDSPYSYSPAFLSPIYNLSSNPTEGTNIKITNLGDVSVYPEIYIDKVGNGEVEIINNSNGGISFKYSYLVADPTVAPTLSTVTNGSSTLPSGTYYVRYTWTGSNGETNVSSEVSISVSSLKNLVVTIPTLPTNGVYASVYIGTTAGTGKLQGTTTTTTFTQSTTLLTAVSAPTTNVTGLLDNETVYTDCTNQFIESDIIPTQYRINNFNNNYLELVFGANNLLVKGQCTLRFRYSYIYLQG